MAKSLKSQDHVLESAMHRNIKGDKTVDKNAALYTVKMAKSAIDKVNLELEYLNKKLIKHMRQIKKSNTASAEGGPRSRSPHA